jgi:hypothetical protein
MKAISAFHFDMNIVASVAAEDSALDIPIEISGDFQGPDKLRALFSMNLVFLTIETEIVSIGNTEYIKDPETGEWHVSAGDAGLFADPTQLIELGAGDLVDLVVKGVETLDDQEVYRLTASTAGANFGGAGEFKLSLWIRTEDALVARIVADGEITLGEAGGGLLGDLALGTSKVSIDLRLSDFDEEVTIEAPVLQVSPEATASPTPAPAEEQQGGPVPTDPVKLIERVNAAMDAVGSMHYEGLIAVKLSEDSDSTLLSLQVSGDGISDGDSRELATAVIALGGFPASFTFEARKVDGVTYGQDPLTQRWRIEESGSTLVGDIAGPGLVRDLVGDGMTVALDVLDGVEVFRISGTLPDDPELDLMVLWVGTGDLLVRRVEVSGRAPASGFQNLVPAEVQVVYMTATLTFSGFGEPVLVEAPELE